MANDSTRPRELSPPDLETILRQGEKLRAEETARLIAAAGRWIRNLFSRRAGKATHTEPHGPTSAAH